MTDAASTAASQSRRKFLVVADDTPEFSAALKYACRRARSTGGHVAMLKVISPAEFEHWSGVREEIERQEREEAEVLLQSLAAQVVAETGLPPEFIIKHADSVRTALKAVVAADPSIKILILATSTAGRGPGPLISAIAKEGVGFSGRKLPVTVVPGDLTDTEIEELA
ncbi:universal stress protein [Caulobacter segnis]|uniref:universal stress protein n=1 Tax=Caulobacter segnis TaxID=88688 RepID=UPI001CC00B4E|nr:universal stress protein [Caulobacter segnis]UAL10723.1 universal stress protein [Caulobacter segnis]